MELKNEIGIKTTQSSMNGVTFEDVGWNGFCRISFNGNPIVEYDKDGRIYICSEAKKVKLSKYYKGKVEGILPKHV